MVRRREGAETRLVALVSVIAYPNTAGSGVTGFQIPSHLKKKGREHATLLNHSNTQSRCVSNLWLRESGGEQAKGHGRECGA